MSAPLATSVAVAGVERVTAHLGSISEATRRQVLAALQRLAIKVQAIANERYLHGPRPGRLGVISGRLTRSLHVRTSDTPTEISASTGTNLAYGRHWELGFHGVETVSAHVRRMASRNVHAVSRDASGRLRRTPVAQGIVLVRAHSRTVRDDPRPFLGPALDDVRPEVIPTISQAVREGLS
jgi:hypothetical protein